MADKIKDADDMMLEALMRAEPIADDGFSKKVLLRVRRRIRLQRFTLPIAAAVGAFVSYKPLSALVEMLAGFIVALPVDVIAVSTSWVPPVPTIMLGGLLFVVLLLGLRTFEE